MKLQMLLFAFILLAVSCDTSEPPPGGEPSVQFSAVDASSTEVWLQVKLASGVQPRECTIARGSQVIFSGVIVTSDTLVVDDGLTPNTMYSYSFSRASVFGQERDSTHHSTLDLSSSNWLLATDTVGASGGLFDVSVLSSNDIWAVGDLYLSGQYRQP